MASGTFAVSWAFIRDVFGTSWYPAIPSRFVRVLQ